MNSAMIDKLMDVCTRHSDEIAEQWYKSLSTNLRTKACLAVPKEACLRHASGIYRSIADMYFAQDCCQAVERTLDVSGFVDTFYARGVPLEQVLYALILLRRRIWLYADSQLIFNLSVPDMASTLESINRILTVFDYASFYVARTYNENGARAPHPAVLNATAVNQKVPGPKSRLPV